MTSSISLNDVSIRTELRPGDIGYVIYMHGDLYGKIVSGFASTTAG